MAVAFVRSAAGTRIAHLQFDRSPDGVFIAEGPASAVFGGATGRQQLVIAISEVGDSPTLEDAATLGVESAGRWQVSVTPIEILPP